jgi:hypothetical protein
MRQPNKIIINGVTLAEILEKHLKWLRGEAGGEQADLYQANLSGADLSQADLSQADLSGADYNSIIIKKAAAFLGLYKYLVLAIISDKNEIHITMGCYFRSLADWDSDFWNNPNEFPNDGSEKSIQRLKAFEFAKDWALRNLELINKEEMK